MRKSIHQNAEYFHKALRNENYLNQLLIDLYFNHIETTVFDANILGWINLEIENKEMHFAKKKSEKYWERFEYICDKNFWKLRKTIIRYYKKVDKKQVYSVFDEIKKQEIKSNNRALIALKALNLQKHDIRMQVYEILWPRKYKRKARGGQKSKRKDKFEKAVKEKNVFKATVSVLKLLMFEESRPDLVPNTKKNEVSRERDGCCLVI